MIRIQLLNVKHVRIQLDRKNFPLHVIVVNPYFIRNVQRSKRLGAIGSQTIGTAISVDQILLKTP